MTEEFAIDDIILKAELNPVKATSGSFKVQSVPFPYSIEWLDSKTNPSTIINADETAIVLIDGRIRKLWFEELRSDVPIFEINATEANKTVYSAIEFAEFMEGIGTTKSNMVYVVGGGIMQDIGAFACAMYKRGIHGPICRQRLGWLTVALAKTVLTITRQGISWHFCRWRIVHFLPFLDTLPRRKSLPVMVKPYDYMTVALASLVNLRPTLTCSEWKLGCNTDDNFWSTFSQTSGSRGRRVRKSLRRSMNYGHSVGHAIEAELCISLEWISLGVIAENMIAVSAYGLELQHAEANRQAMKLIDDDANRCCSYGY